MSPRRLQDTSSRHLEDVFNVTIRLPRRLQDVFARRLDDVLEDKKLLRWRRVEDQQIFAAHVCYLQKMKLVNIYLQIKRAIKVLYYISLFITMPTDHLPTDHRPLTQRPTDSIITDPTDKILFYRQDLTVERYRFYRIQTQLGK